MNSYIRTIAKNCFYFLKLNFRKVWHPSINFDEKVPSKDEFKVFQSNNLSNTIDKTRKSVPKIIWTYWHDGIPTGVADACIKSWKVQMPDYNINIITKVSLFEYLPDFPKLNSKIPLSNLSDVIRLMLLNKFGGIWMDATILLQESIDSYVQFTEFNYLELTGFYRELKSSHPDFENWLLISPGQSPLLEKWTEVMIMCLRCPVPQDFFKNNPKYREAYLSVMPQHRNYLFAYMGFYYSIRSTSGYKIGGVNYHNNGSFLEAFCDNDYDKYAEIVLLNKPFKRPSIIKINGLVRKKIELYIKNNCYIKDSVIGQYL
ncbi:capsular polysaccharide synthesis protein [Rhizosphaericola mali]|uniref:Capsular biosynthesis protein n=1 Tax=Rhizosphaericola mali TaxID=2545455 RepID=A0A5P2G627_9BACT|nr:capsular polysaccharide synthesis protein [Rhizosphaericola mali]QES89190.1 hypothetical protein E0W69_011125 [Rhizosphaericola mali]